MGKPHSVAKKHVKKLELSSAPEDKKLLLLRNILCVISATLFLIAIFSQNANDELHVILRCIAYIFGGLAYVSEILVLTDKFKVNPGIRIMFMPYLFGVLYFLLSLSYFEHWAK